MGKNARQFLFVYDGKAENGEPVQDPDGDIPVPVKDEVLNRNSKAWRVAAVMGRDDGPARGLSISFSFSRYKQEIASSREYARMYRPLLL